MTEKIRAWVNGGGSWRFYAFYVLCQTPTMVLIYILWGASWGL